jgi:hypothetical protein
MSDVVDCCVCLDGVANHLCTESKGTHGVCASCLDELCKNKLSACPACRREDWCEGSPPLNKNSFRGYYDMRHEGFSNYRSFPSFPSIPSRMTSASAMMSVLVARNTHRYLEMSDAAEAAVRAVEHADPSITSVLETYYGILDPR